MLGSKVCGGVMMWLLYRCANCKSLNQSGFILIKGSVLFTVSDNLLHNTETLGVKESAI